MGISFMMMASLLIAATQSVKILNQQEIQYLQQDAFDDIDSCTPRERQLISFRLLKKLIDTDYQFKDKDVARDFFTELTNIYKNWNYSAFDSKEFTNYRNDIVALACQHSNTDEASKFQYFVETRLITSLQRLWRKSY